MLDDIYSAPLLEAAGTIPAERRLVAPTAHARKASKVCGSVVEVELFVKDDIVKDFAVAVKACALGQAAVSILSKSIIGATKAELYQLRDETRAMLKEDGPAPTNPRFAEVVKLQPIKDYPARQASTLLVFDAVCAALDLIGD